MDKLAARVSLDPYLLAVPQVREGPDAAQRYVETLLAWSSLGNEGWLSLHVPRCTLEVLHETESFPAIRAVSRLCEVHGLEDFSAGDVAQVLNAILERANAPSTEEQFGISEMLDEGLTLAPPVPGARRSDLAGRNSDLVAASTERLLGLAGVVRQLGSLRYLPMSSRPWRPSAGAE